HFWYAVSFGGESCLRKVGLSGIHPLTQRYVYAESIEGCYLVADEITSFSSEESEIQSTYVKISRSAGNYSVEG
ncbi:DUF3265 domain-containing protein, partial [Vibrio vulnificus]|nr:DUF3265 domain-containing protein [Vibrio vulnificus]